MRILVFVAALAMTLAGCAATGSSANEPFRVPAIVTSVVAPIADTFLPAPSTIANRTKMDEQAGLTITLGYNAANRSAALLIRYGPDRFREPAFVRRVGELDRQAFAIVMAARQAYLTANSADYTAAIERARIAVAALLRASSGGG